MPYTESDIHRQAQGIHKLLRADSLFEHGANSRGIHIPDYRLIVEPLTKLPPEMISTESQTAVLMICGLLKFAAKLNGLYVRTIDNGTIVDLEIRGMPKSTRGKPTLKEVERNILYTGNRIHIVVGKQFHLGADSEADYNEVGFTITQLFEATPPQQQLFLIGKIVEITAQAVERASH